LRLQVGHPVIEREREMLWPRAPLENPKAVIEEVRLIPMKTGINATLHKWWGG
jgi:hypothetical protein